MGFLFSVGLFIAWFCLAGLCASIIFGAVFYVTVLDPPQSVVVVACAVLIFFIFLSEIPWGLKLSALLALASAPDLEGSNIASFLGVAYLLLIFLILLSRIPSGYKVIALGVLGLIFGVTEAYVQQSQVIPHLRPLETVRDRSFGPIFFGGPMKSS